MKKKHSTNDYATIYPNEKGWEMIIVLTADLYELSHLEAIKSVNEKRTSDGGYKDQLWVIISDFHSMYFNGNDYFENTNISIENVSFAAIINQCPLCKSHKVKKVRSTHLCLNCNQTF